MSQTREMTTNQTAVPADDSASDTDDSLLSTKIEILESATRMGLKINLEKLDAVAEIMRDHKKDLERVMKQRERRKQQKKGQKARRRAAKAAEDQAEETHDHISEEDWKKPGLPPILPLAPGSGIKDIIEKIKEIGIRSDILVASQRRVNDQIRSFLHSLKRAEAQVAKPNDDDSDESGED